MKKPGLVAEEWTMQKDLLIPFPDEGFCAENEEGAGPDSTKSFTYSDTLKLFALLLPESFQNQPFSNRYVLMNHYCKTRFSFIAHTYHVKKTLFSFSIRNIMLNLSRMDRWIHLPHENTLTPYSPAETEILL